MGSPSQQNFRPTSADFRELFDWAQRTAAEMSSAATPMSSSSVTLATDDTALPPSVPDMSIADPPVLSSGVDTAMPLSAPDMAKSSTAPGAEDAAGTPSITAASPPTVPSHAPKMPAAVPDMLPTTAEDPDGSQYYDEVGLGPLARILGLIPPKDNESTQPAAADEKYKDTVYSKGNDGNDGIDDIDNANPTSEPMTMAIRKTGSKAPPPQGDRAVTPMPHLGAYATEGGKVHLHFNYIAPVGDENPSCMLYPVYEADKTTIRFWRRLGHDSPSTRAQSADIFLYKSFTNYKLLVEAFHLMRSRKAELGRQWEAANPGCAGVAPLPHEPSDTELKQCRYQVRSWEKITTFEKNTDGSVLSTSYACRRLVLRRYRPYAFRGEPHPVYILVATGMTVKGKDDDIVVPETEDAYMRLFRFFASQKPEDWGAAEAFMPEPEVSRAAAPTRKLVGGISYRNLAPFQKVAPPGQGSSKIAKKRRRLRELREAQEGQEATDADMASK